MLQHVLPACLFNCLLDQSSCIVIAFRAAVVPVIISHLYFSTFTLCITKLDSFSFALHCYVHLPLSGYDKIECNKQYVHSVGEEEVQHRKLIFQASSTENTADAIFDRTAQELASDPPDPHTPS